MIIPAASLTKRDFTIPRGSTYNQTLILDNDPRNTTYRGDWDSEKAYVTDDTVTLSNVGYVALEQSTNQNPATSTVAWSPLVVLNLTGYTASLPITGGATLTQLSGLTLGGAAGTILIHLTPSQTAPTSVKTAHYSLSITDGSGNVTFILDGSLLFLTP